jgi:hypothetical protein
VVAIRTPEQAISGCAAKYGFVIASVSEAIQLMIGFEVP